MKISPYLTFGILLTSVIGLTVYNIHLNGMTTIGQESSAASETKKIARLPYLDYRKSSSEPEGIGYQAKNTESDNAMSSEQKKLSLVVTEEETLEPSVENADMPATGEYADEVNLPKEASSCTEACVDSMNVNAPASGEFADQINSETILAEAKNKGIEIAAEEKLIDVSATSHPTTELGVYTPPIN